jgi:mRNA interferase MazF
MKRGDLVTVTLPAELGKPRPALIIQSDYFQDLETLTVIPLTSTLQAAPLFRLTIEPTRENGLQKSSQLMIDKAMTLRRSRVGQIIGRVDRSTLVRTNRAIAMFFGIG